MTQQTKSNQLTPLEKLISDKQCLQRKCQKQTEKLNDDFSYIQENAGSLLMSGLSSLLFSSSKSTSKKEGSVSKFSSKEEKTNSTSLGISDFLSISKGILPIIWDVAQPLIMSWGIKKAQKWLINLFTRKRRDPNN